MKRPTLREYLAVLGEGYATSKWMIGIGFCTSLVYVASNIVSPFITRYTVDDILLTGQIGRLFNLFLISLAVIVVAAISGMLSNYLLLIAGRRANTRLKSAVFRYLLHLPLDYVTRVRSGELVFRLLSDVDVLVSSLSMVINLPLNLLILMVLASISSSWHSGLTIFAISVVTLQSFVAYFFREPLRHWALKEKAALQELSGHVVERLRAVVLIRSAKTADLEVHGVGRRVKQAIDMSIAYSLLNQAANIAVGTINNLWAFGVLWYGGHLVARGDLTLGTLMAFMMLSALLYPRVSALLNVVLQYQTINASLARVQEIRAVSPAISEARVPDALPSGPGTVTLRDVSFSYAPGRDILASVSLSMAPRTIIAVAGANGSGKSTLCRLVARVQDPTTGVVFVDGVNIARVSLASLAEAVRYIPQEPLLMSGSILNNLTYGFENLTQAEVDFACSKVKLQEFTSDLPHGVDTFVGEGGSQLSAGQVRRVMVARAFLRHPRVVILDEPTTSVDRETEDTIIQAILALREICTVLVVAHDERVLSIADSVLSLDKGRVTAYGPSSPATDETSGP